MQPRLLQYPDFSKQFIISTDASKEACGAKKIDGQVLRIAHGSTMFAEAESNKAVIEQ